MTVSANLSAYALITAIIFHLMEMRALNPDKFGDSFTMMLQVLIENIENVQDLSEVLWTHLGIWVTIEKQHADLMAGHCIKDNFGLSDSGYTNLNYSQIAEIISKLQKVVTEQ